MSSRRGIAIGSALAGVILSVCCCCCAAGAAWWDGYYLPCKPCRPVLYPEGNITPRYTSREVIDTMDVVLTFYDQRLNVQTNPEAFGIWRRTDLADGRVLYDCYSNDINLLTGETGCIYGGASNGKTQVETILVRSEGGSMGCPE